MSNSFGKRKPTCNRLVMEFAATSWIGRFCGVFLGSKNSSSSLRFWFLSKRLWIRRSRRRSSSIVAASIGSLLIMGAGFSAKVGFSRMTDTREAISVVSGRCKRGKKSSLSSLRISISFLINYFSLTESGLHEVCASKTLDQVLPFGVLWCWGLELAVKRTFLGLTRRRLRWVSVRARQVKVG